MLPTQWALRPRLRGVKILHLEFRKCRQSCLLARDRLVTTLSQQGTHERDVPTSERPCVLRFLRQRCRQGYSPGLPLPGMPPSPLGGGSLRPSPPPASG